MTRESAEAKIRVSIRSPEPTDEPAFLAAARSSRSLHGSWVAPPRTPAAFRAYLERMSQPQNLGFLVVRRDTGALVGVINLTNIVLGPFRSGYLGFYAFLGHERRGLMHEGLALVVRHAFRKLGLHRVEANIQPGNAPSIALARSCGFRKEGCSPRYLKVAGRWRDHERWALVAP